MPRQMWVTVGAWMVLALLATSAAAQGTSAASITGVVRDASGAVLPGVTIEVASPALIEGVRAAVTDSQGAYRIIELRTGTYAVTFTLPGFAVFKRDGLQLPPNFTATINAELRVGAIEELITVTGETPQVDVQNINQQKTISKELLDTVPTGRSVIGFAALMPAAVNPATAQDVGGSMGESSVRISVHGAKQGDQKLLQDGMAYNILGQGGTGRTFFVNPLGTQEVVIDVGSGGSAEYSLGGAIVNLIPKDGGNQFSGTLFTAAANHAMQASNLTDDLRAQGLQSVNGVRHIYDANMVVGGPIRQNRLWFMSSHRLWGRRSRIANLFRDADTTDWVFTPDPSRPGDAGEDFRAHNIRLTWQATTSNKFTVAYDSQDNRSNVQGGALASGVRSLEAITNPDVYCNKPNLIQGTWTRPSQRLLFEAGSSTLLNYRDLLSGDPCGGDIYANAVREQSTNFIYHGSGNRFTSNTYHTTQRFSVSYVTSAHTLKAGMSAMETLSTPGYTERGAVGFPVDYTFNFGRPASLTQYVSPLIDDVGIRPDLGIFVQDQWSLDRVTLKAGLRYQYHRAFSAAIDQPEGLLGPPATHYPAADCLPCWHDLNPRLAMAWDVFGDGNTAVKGSLDRFVGAVTTGLAVAYGPSGAQVVNTTRAWTDTNANFYPDCNLRSSGANGECGAMANSSFGQSSPQRRADPDWVSGWNNRPYNWSTSVSIDHQLRPGIALNAGYYRRWYGNFTVLDNTLVTPADYDPFCITVPTDSQLGSMSGRQVCGLYDIKPGKFGLVDTVETLAKNFGDQTEVFNGLDANFAVRIAGGATVSGGWNVGNSVNTATTSGNVGIALGTNSKTNSCFVVDSPQQLYNCESGNPYQHRVKVNGSYPLPKDMQLALVYQNLPGPNYDASIVVPTADIAPSLGRPLAGGTRNVTVGLFVPNSQFLDDRVNQLDVRVSKIIRFGGKRVQGNFDLYNLFNNNAVLNVNSAYGPSWLRPTQILDARLAKISFQVDF